MKFLVLGGNGYLGAKITKRLIDNGHAVVCTKREKSDLSRLNGYEDKIIFIEANDVEVEAALKREPFDWVLNMVCNYGKNNILYDNVIESNLMFPLSVLNLAVELGVKNFMTIGTGLPADLNMYSFAKSRFSDFGKFYVEKHGINFIDMKLEMFYGADEPENRFLPSCIRKMLNGEDIELTLGTQKRDIVSIYDVVNAIDCAIEAKLTGYHVISVGTGQAPTIREILEYAKEVSDSTSELHFGTVPMRKGEPDCVADTSSLEKIGYKCTCDWKSGILNMIQEVCKNENIN